MTSPLWYRARGSIFALIYLAGFGLPAAVDAIAGAPYVPAFVQLGSFFGGGLELMTALVIVLALCCWALRVWGSAYLRAETVWNLDARADTLVIDGPFRYTRNPLYLGNVFMALGYGLLAPLVGWILIVAATLLYVHALARWEELVLRMRFGNAFDYYAKNVPQMLPRRTPFGASTGIRPSLRQGITAEIFSAALFAGMLAVLFAPAFGWAVFALCFAGGAIVQRRLARA